MEITIIISTGVQAIATVILVYITHKQIGQSQKSIESMDNSTKAQFLPVLMLGFVTNQSTDKSLSVQLINCGKGIARKPKVIFPGQPDIVINSINTGQEDSVRIEYNMEFILKKTTETERKIIVEYHDVFGRKITTEANLTELNNIGSTGTEKGIGFDSWTPIIP